MRPSFDWCGCVLGTINRQQLARFNAGAPMDFSAFYAQRERPFFRRDNQWLPSE